MSTAITSEVSNRLIERFMTRHTPAAGKVSRSMGDYIVKIGDGGWASECDVLIRLDTRTVTISWSSTQRTVVQAMAALVLYQQAVAFAALAQNFLDDNTVLD
jgi:hypothetical protein